MSNIFPSMPTIRQVETVQTTFELVCDNTATFAASFYDHLLRLDPSVRARFRRDITEGGQMLMCVVSIAVEGLNDLSQIMPVIRDLGRWHVGYTEEFARCRSVGPALLLALGEVLKAAFTGEVAAAWSQAYTHFSELLLAEIHPPDTAQVIAIRWVDAIYA